MKSKIIIITLLIMLICANVYGANTTLENYQWSDTPRKLSETDFYNIVEGLTGISGETFSSYRFTNNSSGYTSNYNTFKNGLNSTSTKAFGYYNGLFTVWISNGNYIPLQYNANNNGYYAINSSQYAYTFDFENKVIKYYIYVALTPDSKEYKWKFNDTSNITSEEFLSYAYQQKLLFDTMDLVIGPVYSAQTTQTTSQQLNDVYTFKIEEISSGDEIYTGNIDFSTEFESWITENLSENFINNTFTYYLEAHSYNEGGVSFGHDYEIPIGSIHFTNNSTYHPSIQQVQTAMEQIEGYMNYAYTITLRPFENINSFVLSSDLFIVDAKPIAMIPFFKLTYDYINYSNYITEKPSGDNSGDNGTGSIVGDIEER